MDDSRYHWVTETREGGMEVRVGYHPKGYGWLMTEEERVLIAEVEFDARARLNAELLAKRRSLGIIAAFMRGVRLFFGRK